MHVSGNRADQPGYPVETVDAPTRHTAITEAARMSFDRTKLLETHASAGVGVADTTQASSFKCPEAA